MRCSGNPFGDSYAEPSTAAHGKESRLVCNMEMHREVEGRRPLKATKKGPRITSADHLGH